MISDVAASWDESVREEYRILPRASEELNYRGLNWPSCIRLCPIKPTQSKLPRGSMTHDQPWQKRILVKVESVDDQVQELRDLG